MSSHSRRRRPGIAVIALLTIGVTALLAAGALLLGAPIPRLMCPVVGALAPTSCMVQPEAPASRPVDATVPDGAGEVPGGTGGGDRVAEHPVEDLGYDPTTGVETLADGSRVSYDDAPTQGQLQRMAVADTELRLRIPAVGLDAELKTMSAYREDDGSLVLNPPTAADPYLLRDWDGPGSKTGMSVIAAHAIWGKTDPAGSKLIDIRRHRSTVPVGATVMVGRHVYLVESTQTVRRSELGERASIWAHPEGKLLIVTCIYEPDGTILDNVVISARLRPGT